MVVALASERLTVTFFCSMTFTGSSVLLAMNLIEEKYTNQIDNDVMIMSFHDDVIMSCDLMTMSFHDDIIHVTCHIMT